MGATHLGYGIFVRFRQSRLPLRRGIARLEDALALADQIRAERFHKQDAVFVVKEPEGIIVTAASLEEEPAPSAPPPVPAPVPASLSPSPIAPPADDALPPAPARPVSGETAFGQSVDPAALRRWTEQLQAMQRALAQARRAQARLESAYAAAGSLIRIHGEAPDAFVYHHQRLGSLCDSTRRTVASVERSAAMVERHLQAAWAGRAPFPALRAGA
jgi:hypothetical protein